jgi:hypothetical protein
LKTLANSLGYCPLDYEPYRPQSDRWKSFISIQSFNSFKEAIKQSPRLQSALPLINLYSTLYLNRFRGKPAISRFDKLFTPSHSSSQALATDMGSILVPLLLEEERNLSMASSSGFGSSSYNFCIIIFHYCINYVYVYHFKLKLAIQTNSLTHYAKGTLAS